MTFFSDLGLVGKRKRKILPTARLSLARQQGAGKNVRKVIRAL
jgi:hypothetical protein